MRNSLLTSTSTKFNLSFWLTESYVIFIPPLNLHLTSTKPPLNRMTSNSSDNQHKGYVYAVYMQKAPFYAKR